MSHWYVEIPKNISSLLYLHLCDVFKRNLLQKISFVQLSKFKLQTLEMKNKFGLYSEFLDLRYGSLYKYS